MVRHLCRILVVWLSLSGEAKRPKISDVEAMIAALREKERKAPLASLNSAISSGHKVGALEPMNLSPPIRPLTEAYGEGSMGARPCDGVPGLVVRREMGNLGVTSFQVALAALAMDSLGPTWSYYDDWPKMAYFLRKDRHVSKEEADRLRRTCRFKASIMPFGQEDLQLTPFNATGDGVLWRHVRAAACGAKSEWGRAGRPTGGERDCIVLKFQGHWEHAGYFYRYRRFLASAVFRSTQSMVSEYVNRPALQGGADLVVYLRLGDKTQAGDTLLTFEAGYYEAVLDQRRKHAKTCWIVTQTPHEAAAQRLSKQYSCALVSNPKQYTDWTLLLTAPHTLVLAASTFAYFQALIGAAKEVHYPAVGFFHDKHNVCMRTRNTHSHFGQMRLPFKDARMVYHDVYSRQFFLTFDELAAQAAALPCDSILDQHVCDAPTKKDANMRRFGAESRYCYRELNATSRQAKAHAVEAAGREAKRALEAFRKAGSIGRPSAVPLGIPGRSRGQDM